MNKFSEVLSELMKEKNISQIQLARYLNVGQQTVSKYMNHKIEPSLDTVIKIAKYFEVSTDYLLGLED